VLSELEGAFLDQAVLYETGCKREAPQYSVEALRSVTYMFISVLLAKAYEKMKAEHLSLDQCGEIATKIGEDIKELIQKHTGLNSHEFLK
jgi:hypothetical protein